MMKSLDVSKEDRDIFREKMSIIGNLRAGKGNISSL